jgi:hypothetical protein
LRFVASPLLGHRPCPFPFGSNALFKHRLDDEVAS